MNNDLLTRLLYIIINEEYIVYNVYLKGTIVNTTVGT